MSSLWTPDGEHRVGPGGQSEPGRVPAGGRTPGAGAEARPGAEPDAGLSEEEQAMAQHLAELRGQLLAAPVEVVVANHAYGLFELAAMHLSEQPPGFAQARLAIDALGAVVEGLAGRLGEAEPSLVEALAQIRLAFVQIQAVDAGATPDAPPAGPGA